MTNRRLNPTERAVLNAMTGDMTASQVVLAVSEAQGYEMNAGTIRGALSNLKAWGLISAKPIPRPPAPRVTYRRETMDHKGNTE